MHYSIVIPVYNRPDEVAELLESLSRQTYTDFEVIIVEDGSSDRCLDIVEEYHEQLEITYFYKENSGQGFSRNYGFDRANGDYFIVFDSDCLVPSHYLETVNNRLKTEWLDAYGGPDRAHENFSSIQKAISYAMTSPLTTGGIRGRKKHAGTFHPRSFNMGISREVYEKTGGYRITRMGEDIEFSIRIIKNGFQTGLIEDAYVYHKRRTSLTQFFKQLHFFGRARINVSRYYPGEIKFIHTLPSLFVLATILIISLPFWKPNFFLWLAISWLFPFLLTTVDSSVKNKSLYIGLLSSAASIIQLAAYGIGFLTEFWRKLRE